MLIVLLLTAAIDYWRTQHEIDELFDAQLAQTSRLLSKITSLNPDLATRATPLVVPVPSFIYPSYERPASAERTAEGHKYESQLSFQIWNEHGQLLVHSENITAAPLAPFVAGYAITDHANKRWMTFTLHDPTAQQWLQTAQQLDVREELSWYLVSGQIGQMLLSMLGLSLLIYLIVQRLLRPVDALRRQVATTDASALQPFSLALPSEIAPVQTALNSLILDINAHIEQEKRFVSDASHELRTPLTVLRLHAQNLVLADGVSSQQKSLDAIQASTMQLSQLVDQLLLLGRADRELLTEAKRLNVQALVEKALGDLGEPWIDRVVWSLDIDDACAITGDYTLLTVAMRNILENAAKYAPADSAVHVQATDKNGQVCISIHNELLEAQTLELERFTDRFFRSPSHLQLPGTGLGLSIVQQIADLHHASLTLKQPTPLQLTVSLIFPAAAPSNSLLE